MDKASKSQGTGQTASRGVQQKSKLKGRTLLIVGLILLAALFHHFKMEHPSPPLAKEPSIGNQDLSVAVIQAINGDGRQKPERSEQWYQAQQDSNVILGDSVYSGDNSEVTALIRSGGKITIGSKTLVIFDSFDGITLPNLAQGTVRLKLDSKTSIALSGTVVAFEGADGELLLETDLNGQTKARLLSGHVSAKFNNHADAKPLTINQDFQIEPAPALKPKIAQILATLETTNESPKDLSPKTNTVHYLRVVDVYRRAAQNTILRKLSSSNESTLSAPLPLAVGIQAYPSIPIAIAPEGVRVRLSVSNNNELFKGYLFEASPNHQFEINTVAVKWSPSTTIDINIKKSGTFYYRVRGVNENNELTPLSSPASFTVYEPAPAPIIHAQAYSQQKVDVVMNPEPLEKAETRSPSSKPDKNTQMTTIAAPILEQQVSNKISWWGQLQQSTSLVHYEGENWTKLERVNQDILGGTGELTIGMWLPQSRWGFAGSYAFSGFLLKKDLLFYQNAAIMAGYKSHLLGGFLNILAGAGYHQFPELVTKNFMATEFSGENNSAVGVQSKLEYLLPLRNNWGLRTTGNVFWGPFGISSADRGTVSESYEYSLGVHLTYNYDNFITGMLGYTYQAGFAAYPSDPTNTTYNSSRLQGHYLGLTLLLNPTALEVITKK